MEKTATKQADILFVVRPKTNNLVIYIVQGSSCKYHVTTSRGRISSCCDDQDNTCKAWLYRRTCKHTEAVTAKIESDKQQEQSTREALPLNGNREFSLMR